MDHVNAKVLNGFADGGIAKHSQLGLPFFG
jgi:hypothetical protein